MLEIIVIIVLSKRIIKIVKPKGHRPSRYILTMLLLWLSLEMLCIAIGVKITGDLMASLPFGLIGAAIGGYLGYKLALNAPDINIEKQTP